MDKNIIKADKITTEYIDVNGKKIKFTPEQKEELAKALESPFARKVGEKFYFLDEFMDIFDSLDYNTVKEETLYDVGNYCTDEAIMKQHALHMMLYSMLWRFSMMRGGDEIDWRNYVRTKFTIYYDFRVKKFNIAYAGDCKNIGIYFLNEETAEAAIEEVIKPFMEEHPDFDWAAM